MTEPDRLLLMGRLGRAHGVRGDVKVTPETDDPTRFATLARVFVGETPETAAERRLAGVRFQYPKGRTVVLLAFEGQTTKEAADEMRGLQVYAHDADLPPLADGQAYLHDLAGLAVWRVDDAGEPAEELGVVRDLYDGAQLLFGIARPDGSEVLLPDVDEFVVAVDLAGRRLLVRPPDGLFEDGGDVVEGGDEPGGA